MAAWSSRQVTSAVTSNVVPAIEGPSSAVIEPTQRSSVIFTLELSSSLRPLASCVLSKLTHTVSGSGTTAGAV